MIFGYIAFVILPEPGHVVVPVTAYTKMWTVLDKMTKAATTTLTTFITLTTLFFY